MTSRVRLASSAAIATLLAFVILVPDAAAQVCSITWDGGGGNAFWQNRFNWNPDRLPTAADNVCSGPNVVLSDFNSTTINTITGGSLTIPQSGTFLQISAGGTLSGSLTIQGGQVTNNGTLSVTGLVTIRNGTLTGTGTTNALGGAVFDGLVDLFSHTFNNSQTASFSSSSARLRMPAGVFNNLPGATFNLGDGIGFDSLGVSSSRFSNQGLVLKAAVAFLTQPTIFGGVQFQNAGTLEVQQGILRFTAPWTQTEGATLLTGGSLESTVGLNLQGGVLAGTGIITGNVLAISTAVVAPGGVGLTGTLQIVGTYTQQSGATLAIELAGAQPNQFDRVLVSGVATLGGTLNAGLISGFNPTPGSEFAVMTFASRVGTFAPINAPAFTAQANDGNVTLVASTTCGYQVAVPQQSFGFAGGATGVTINTGAGCAWTATDDVDWIDIVPDAGSGSTTVALAVGPNTGARRTTIVTVAGVSFSVDQEAGPCEYSLSSSGQSFTSDANTGAFNVGTRSDCSWTAQKDVPWIQITSPPAGTGEGQIQFQVSSNTGLARVGSIDVSGTLFTIEQAAPTQWCVPGSYSVVLEPAAPRQMLWEDKPLRVSYGQLELTFTVTDQGAYCQAVSNVGELPVLVTNTITGVELQAADSIASATIRIYPPETITVPGQCSFSKIPGFGVNDECALNEAGSNAYYANWTTSGFLTRVLFQSPLESIDCCPTGPRSYWVNLDALSASPATGATISAMLNVADRYIHLTLIDNLIAVDKLTFVQDPGNVNLVVVDRQGRATGRLRDNRTTNGIPGSLYLPSDSFPAVLLFGDASVEPLQVLLYGRQSGDFDLAVTSSHAPEGLPAGTFSGVISIGQTLGFGIAPDPGSGELKALSTPVVDGDLTGDGLVTCADVSVVKAAFGKRTGQSGFNAWADRVFPGVIDVRDLAFVAQRLPAGTICQ